jgi:hypothetical protein
MCSFDVPTKIKVSFEVHYKILGEIGNMSWQFNLKEHTYNVLLATGGSVTPDFNLTYHGHGNGQVCTKKFSRKEYNKAIDEVPGLRPSLPLTCLTLIVFQFLALILRV